MKELKPEGAGSLFCVHDRGVLCYTGIKNERGVREWKK